MKSHLVGYTGFVGSNLMEQYSFSERYNSKNIEEAFGRRPDLMVYAGVRAEKYLANQNPSADLDHIENAVNNMKRINPQKLVLISTIDVYKNPVNVVESTPVISQELQPYGANRYYLEKKIREAFPTAHILRLPGLFGKNIKKNFIYDLIHLIPSMLSKDKFEELSSKNLALDSYYDAFNKGYYKCKHLSNEKKEELKRIFAQLEFSALSFTDSRSVFQFYNLKHLWNHIQKVIANDIPLLNLATEPINAEELHFYLTGDRFHNIISSTPPLYDFKTSYDTLFGGENGYIYSKYTLLEEIKKFIQEQLC